MTRRIVVLLGMMLTSLQAETGGGDGPPVSKDAVQEILSAEKDTWLKTISAGRPRLYFTGDALPALRESWKSATGKKRELLDIAVKTARRIARAPVPEYIDPDKAENPWYARNELWLRDVGDSIVALTFGSLVEKDPQMDAKLRELVLTACKYPTWGRVGPNIDLACAHMARAIAIAWDWRPDLWTPEDRAVITTTIAERVHALLEGNYGRVAWARGYNENHHHVALAALGLCGISFYQDIPEAPEWLASAVAGLRNTGIYACADGSSPEGVPYWSYSLSFILQLLEGMRPVVDVAEFYRMPILSHAVDYRLNSSAPGLASAIPWGDAVSRDFYGPHHILHRLAAEYNDPTAQWLARELPFSPQGSIDVPLWNFLWYDPAITEAPPSELDHFQTVGNVAVMRSGWSDDDILFSVKAGFTNRNHSHLDAGSLALSIGDEWLLTTPGYGEGRHNPDFWKTDGPRWEYLSNATESHSTLVINGGNQLFDPQAQGIISEFVSLPGWIWTEVDLRRAYAGVEGAIRTVLHRRGEYFLVDDAVQSPADMKVEWLVQAGKPAAASNRVLTIRGENGEVALTALAPESQFVPRKPVSKKPDLKPGRLETYALSGTGRDVTFLVFGRIAKFPGPVVSLEAKLVSRSKDLTEVEVSGPDWKDFLSWSGATSKRPLAGTDGGTIAADRVAVRVDKAGMRDVAATGGTSFQAAGFDFAFTAPADFELARVAEGAWLLTLPGDTQGMFQWPTGLKMQNLASSEELPAGNDERKLARGSYAITGNDAGVQACRARLSPKVSTREGRAIIPLEPQPALEPSVRVAVEAEDFIRQGNGSAEIVEKPGASGTSLRGFGNESNRHWVAWKFPVKTAGKYGLQVRYCTAAENATASVLVDGRAVSTEALKVSFPSTGGWSNSRSDWREKILTGENGTMLLLDLPAGEHEIVLADPSAAVNLDMLELVGAGGGTPVENP